MITIDPLYLFLLGEASAGLAAAAVILFIRGRKFRRLLEDHLKRFEEGRLELKRRIEEMLRDMDAAAAPAPATDNTDEMRIFTKGFLSTSLASVEHGCVSPLAFWESLQQKFTDMVRNLLRDKHSLNSAQEESLRKLQELEEQKDSLAKNSAQESEDLRTRVSELEETLSNKDREVAEWKAKFESMENEYLVLYQETAKQ